MFYLQTLAAYLIIAATKKAAPSKIIFTNQVYNMSKQFFFFRGGARENILAFLHAHYLEKTYFQPFFIIILICASTILFPWNLNEYTTYYLSPDPFCYIVSTLFLYAEYEEPCLSAYQENRTQDPKKTQDPRRAQDPATTQDPMRIQNSLMSQERPRNF